MASTQHPEGLEEGLRQSAAGEVVDLGNFEQYADEPSAIEDFVADAPDEIQSVLFDISGWSSEHYSREFHKFRPRAEQIAQELFESEKWKSFRELAQAQNPKAIDPVADLVSNAVYDLHVIIARLEGVLMEDNYGYYRSMAQDIAEKLFGDNWGTVLDSLEDSEEDERYIPVELRRVGEIFVLSEKDKDSWPNGRNYERFTVTREYDENYAVPLRPSIIAQYTESDLGYLIQQTEDGFRYIGVELGEDDVFGPFVATEKAALQAAVGDWRENGQGDSWAAWSRQMAKDSVASNAPEIDPKKIEEFLIGSAAGIALTEDEIKVLAEGLAAHLSKGE